MRKSSGVNRIGAYINTKDGEQGFWPSFADMMSSIALVLFFLMLLAYIQNLITGNQLTSTREQLALTATRLQDTIGLVEDAQNELTALNDNLGDVRASLAMEQERLDDSIATIAGQEQMIQWQQEYIDATTEDLYQMRSQMHTIALLRLSILEQVKDAIELVLGTGASVEIGENGNIILGESLFFDYDSAQIKADRKKVLVELGAAFYLFLDNAENVQYVDAIVISGHTDNKGTAAYNRDLSARRANAVLDFLMEESDLDMVLFEDKFAASGYGATRPIDTNDTAEGRQNNRRIEISIILRDEGILKIVEEYLGEPIPGTEAAPDDGLRAI